MTLTRRQLAVVLAAVGLAGVALAIKLIWFPTVEDSWFRLDRHHLDRLPANMLVIRPTHFPGSKLAGVIYSFAGPGPGQHGPRILGRNASLSQVLAAAYGCPAELVLLPPEATTNHFDFLVTLRAKPMERLKAALRRKLGYSADMQERYVEVMQLKVRNPNAPALRQSGGGPPGAAYDSATSRLYFTNQPVAAVARLLQYAFKKTVQDKTGLSRPYDFSLFWNTHGWGGWSGADQASLKASLGELGLVLENDSDLQTMLVVERER
jgi:uncharacterized protein (TIGR03435 family)